MSKVVHFHENTESPRLCEQDVGAEKSKELSRLLVQNTEDSIYIMGSRLCRKCCAKLGLTSRELRVALRLREL